MILSHVFTGQTHFSLHETLVQLPTWCLFPLSQQIKALNTLGIRLANGEQRNHVVPSLIVLTVSQTEKKIKSHINRCKLTIMATALKCKYHMWWETMLREFDPVY